MTFRMKIQYPDGTIHDGKKDFTLWTDHLGISDFDFSGLSVHDVATDEGWWAFWCEMRGAKYVQASDVERFEDYDWGYTKDQTFIDQHNSARGGRSVFDFHHEKLNSKVVVTKQSVYEISGRFDVIFCHGLLYHLRHPLLAIDRMRQACVGMLIMETFVDGNADPITASMKFYRTHELGPISNWCGASTACITSWLKDSGFKHVFYTDPHFPRSNRQIFVALVDDRFLPTFENRLGLKFCDQQYWRQVFDRTKFSDKLIYQGE